MQCFSCEKKPQKYITGLCEDCHQIATVADRETFPGDTMKPHEHLFEMQSRENNGRGVQAVRNICHDLSRNDLRGAQAAFNNDFDKIRNYPEIAKWLNEFFGTNLT